MESRDIEEMTIKFLSENDSEYFNRTGYKSDMIEYPYLSRYQQRERSMTELPLSSLSNRQRLQCPKLGDSHNFEGE